MITKELHERFLTNTDETGRFIVTSQRTGRHYYVEPIGDSHVKWGSIDPANNRPGAKLMHKGGDGKHQGSITERESLITEGNGFTKITYLEKGTSPLAAVDFLDAKYPDKVPHG